MTLRTRVIVATVAVAVPVAVLLTFTISSSRMRERRVALERVAGGMLNDQVRERCESDPVWFLAGPLDGRPKGGIPDPNPDILPPRPKVEERPFEFFAYDDEFTGSSSAAPRFPSDFKRVMRATPPESAVTAVFETSAGTGVQTARLTGWSPGPCAVLLLRVRPLAGEARTKLATFAGLTVALGLVALAVAWPIAGRTRRFLHEARQSARTDYSSSIEIRGRDELGALASAFNEAAADSRRRAVDVKDRDEALRRFITGLNDAVARDLAELEARSTGQAAGDAHLLSGRLDNLVATARLRMHSGPTARESVDLGEAVRAGVARHAAFARRTGVSLECAVPNAPVPVVGDPSLFEQAVSNLVENAVRFNRSGGHVSVRLGQDAANKRFLLHVSDDGPGVTDDQLARLSAVHRFRGDEGRARTPGDLGLGLAVAREVAERFQMLIAFRHPMQGGLEVELQGRTT